MLSVNILTGIYNITIHFTEILYTDEMDTPVMMKSMRSACSDLFKHFSRGKGGPLSNREGARSGQSTDSTSAPVSACSTTSSITTHATRTPLFTPSANNLV